ncbi:hypothetical protein BGW36DRAFT_143533 [Talaromyces proteolyticus]|uniref:DUF3074 domain-containing protein n=1 Tax=Talaromyces proteolyticus TaxID=1131652 RepID=A0AAD4KS80_9EURO|nr:uncharacterized protein BGW36DRAFT_143533 [Talaromyces proteolyticus]KAH8698281.1 hypothetical protein BGW36DRAFT_143533 [Talaromyces proteolyticus]
MPFLQLTPQTFSSLPPHPSLGNNDSSSSSPSLEKFLISALTEAQTFITQTIPQTFIPDPKPRSSSPSSAKVQLLTRTIREKDYWVCRKSVHNNAAEKGSASWAEFERGLRENHSENEMAYTPSVSSVEHLSQWPVQKVLGDGWRDVDMHINMITHSFKPGALISPRTFISLVISAYEPPQQSRNNNSSSQSSTQGFYTIQIPLAFNEQSDIPDGLKNKIKSAVPKKTIFAHYASVEHVLLKEHTSPGHNINDDAQKRRIEWTMATVSDAGGHIPQWVQRSWTMGGVPKAVVADVGLFLGWTDQQRHKSP